MINIKKGAIARSAAIICLVSSALSIHAAGLNLAPFKSRFEFVRDDQGTLQYVKDNSIKMNFSIRPYLKFIKQTLQQEQALMKQKGDYDQSVRELFNQDEQNFLGNSNKGTGQSQVIVDSLRSLEDVDFDEIFANSKFNDLMKRYEKKISDALLMLNPGVLAHATDKNFFYQKKVTHQILTWALNFAKKRMSQVPILNTASYVLVRVEELVRQRREFHQNMLLHYLENASEQELGLTTDEMNHIMSSVYESRIGWFAFWESRMARAQWDTYGYNSFYSYVRMNNNRFRRQGSIFDNVGTRLNYGFQDAVKEGERVVINKFHTEHMFSGELATAYSYDNPNKVMRKRIVVQLADLGLSFVPMPSFIKGIAEDFIQSFYKEQALVEGGLYAYFESHSQDEELTHIEAQILNPFESL